MSILADYGLFFAKTITATLAAVVVLSTIAQAKKQAKSPEIELVNLSKKREALLKRLGKQIGLKRKTKAKKKKDKPNLFVLTFDGDMQASATKRLGEHISAVLGIADPSRDQVLIKITSPGGQVSAYGLAASQLLRLTDAGIHTHAVVDTVAASGGYLMAAMADRITAAPFAILGSIGVILQAPNFYRFLKERNIDVEQITAGEHKRNLTLFTHNSEEDRAQAQAQVDQIHKQFIKHVHKKRPKIKTSSANGDVFLAEEALKYGLVDALGTFESCLEAAFVDYTVWGMPEPKAKSKLKSLLGAWQSLWLNPLGFENKL